MSEELQGPVTGHVYDGIQEYDNPTPGWWTMIFFATVIFSVLYWFVATLSNGGLSAEAEYAADKKAETVRQFGSIGELTIDAPTLLQYSADPKWLAVGEAIFISKCAACHAKDGGGINGSNLTDDLYIHVKSITDVADVISDGRNNGAMPAWKTSLSTNEIVMVSSYVSTLRGQNKSGKAPEPNAVPIGPWVAK
jgi:cytochrome c oxidase cbb3-type subunit III